MYTTATTPAARALAIAHARREAISRLSLIEAAARRGDRWTAAALLEGGEDLLAPLRGDVAPDLIGYSVRLLAITCELDD